MTEPQVIYNRPSPRLRKPIEVGYPALVLRKKWVPQAAGHSFRLLLKVATTAGTIGWVDA